MTDMDCIAVCENEKTCPVTYRHLTMSYADRRRDHVYTAAIIMKGLWLEAAGFTMGTKVDAQVKRGSILLTTQQPPKELESIMTLAQAIQLVSGKKRRS
ncbi:SymE family type I addiction module toxin [Brenneria corticis]|uniref:Toxin SymE-like domain-containing protein n=1 Tax=Brenneria corticis TaxID=2173106 RepID=A0A2U1UBM1_9GAMM|nr:SymE family type I addiction module toxin [Brenneria sp. CFCC 11842]PWC18964.1 hypothetical protein DDT56_03195 [Brenneria sp. CFCC 11842]